jgi:hypothetical protein
MNYQLVNNSHVCDTVINGEVESMIAGRKHPAFILLIATPFHNGFCITFPDGVTSVIFIQFKDINAFRRIFKHEFTHLIEHFRGIVQEPIQDHKVTISGGISKETESKQQHGQ